MALEAARGTKIVSQIASEYVVHSTQVGDWKHQLLGDGPKVFAQQPNRQARNAAKTETELYEQIGRLKMELEWLKKKAATVPGGAPRHVHEVGAKRH